MDKNSKEEMELSHAHSYETLKTAENMEIKQCEVCGELVAEILPNETPIEEEMELSHVHNYEFPKVDGANEIIGYETCECEICKSGEYRRPHSALKKIVPYNCGFPKVDGANEIMGYETCECEICKSGEYRRPPMHSLAMQNPDYDKMLTVDEVRTETTEVCTPIDDAYTYEENESKGMGR